MKPNILRKNEFSPGDIVKNSLFYGDIIFGIVLAVARDENGIENVRVLTNNNKIKWYKFYNIMKIENK